LRIKGNPRPQDYAALKGYQGGYRIDQGEYRILYTIDDDNKLVDVFRVGKRNDDEVYKNL
jgi:mRNA interferase RelE/StbE